MNAAAETAGEGKAAYALPPWPSECSQPIERVTPKAGEKARWTQKRWEIVADANDRRIGDCATFYRDLRSRLAN